MEFIGEKSHLDSVEFGEIQGLELVNWWTQIIAVGRLLHHLKLLDT
jgi:hypothetical protein